MRKPCETIKKRNLIQSTDIMYHKIEQQEQFVEI